MGKAANCRASQANNASAMSVEMDRCDSVCDVSTVGNVENAIEGGYIRVNMRVG